MAAETRPGAAALLASPVRRALLDALERRAIEVPDDPGMTAAELAPRVELHVTTVRFHLDQLVTAGVLRSEFHRHPGVGRPRKVYLVDEGAPTTRDRDPLRLLTGLLVVAMATSLHGEAVSPVEAGRRWAREHLPDHPDRSPADTAGTWLARVGEVVDVLESWGYHPDLSTSEGGRAVRIELAGCPFREFARADPAVVCGVHQGLVAESLRQFGETDTGVSLEPFVTPDHCLARLRTGTPFRSP